MSDAITVRLAEGRDVSTIVGLSALLFAEDAGQRDAFTNTRWPLEEGAEYFSAMISDEGSFCLVARTRGESVGYLAARVKEGSSLRLVKSSELESMYVKEECRSLGVGRMLAEEFFRITAAEGCQVTSVTAYASNTKAISFYKKLGFQPKSISFEREIG